MIRVRRTATAVALVVAAAGALPMPAGGQELVGELRAGGAIGNYTGTGAGLDVVPRPSLAATVGLRLTELVSAYVGVNWSWFGCNESLCADRDVSLASRGARLGVRLSRGVFWGRAGAALQSLRVGSDAATEVSDLDVGLDLAAGVEVPVGGGLLIRPGLTYLRHGVTLGGSDGHVALLALEVGVAMTLTGQRR